MVQEGATALFMASNGGYTAVVQLLLIHGAKIDIQKNVCKISYTHDKPVLFSLSDTEWCISPFHNLSAGP